jgi:hypothetical protein
MEGYGYRAMAAKPRKYRRTNQKKVKLRGMPAPVHNKFLLFPDMDKDKDQL